MPTSTKQGGVWKTVNGIHVKDSGAWKEVQNAFIKEAGVWKETHAVTPPSALPAGWTEAAISTAVLHPSGSEENAGTWTWRGAGEDIWNKDDQIVFIYNTLSDGQQIDAYIQTLILEGGTTGDLEQYSGIYLMARQGLLPGDKMLAIGTNPNANRIQQKKRWENDFVQEANTSPGTYVGVYFRIVRSGGVITTSYSLDGTTYTDLGITPTIGTADWFAGIAVSSHDDATPDYIISTGTMSIT